MLTIETTVNGPTIKRTPPGNIPGGVLYPPSSSVLPKETGRSKLGITSRTVTPKSCELISYLPVVRQGPRKISDVCCAMHDARRARAHTLIHTRTHRHRVATVVLTGRHGSCPILSCVPGPSRHRIRGPKLPATSSDVCTHQGPAEPQKTSSWAHTEKQETKQAA